MALIGVAVGTYGDRDFWAPLVERALQSVFKQTCQPKVQWVHDDTLHEARNAAAKKLIKQGCEWLVFLDADDELEPDYVLSMALSASSSLGPDSDWPVFFPATRAVIDGVSDEFTHVHRPEQNLIHRNFVNIGAMHKATMFQAIGGFDDWPVLEDWAYYTKAWVHGADFHPVEDAVYRAYMDSDRPGRNISADPIVVSETCTKIRAMYSFLAKKQGLV